MEAAKLGLGTIPKYGEAKIRDSEGAPKSWETTGSASPGTTLVSGKEKTLRSA